MPRPTILLTGYWPPTNEMLRRFSTNPLQNRAGWIGEDWEQLGFDVYAHFPEFPPGWGPAEGRGVHGSSSPRPWGVGDFEVDYRRTWNDFERLVRLYQPAAIVTFSRGKRGSLWYPEPACRRWRLPGEAGPPGVGEYISDRREPGFPIGLPICDQPPGTVHHSTLPMEAIVHAVTKATNGRVQAFVPPMDESFDYGGAYLSGFIGLLGTSHQHRTPACLAAGHVHVGIDTPVEDARLAAEATVRAVIADIGPRVANLPPA